jgi:hypothetical protein
MAGERVALVLEAQLEPLRGEYHRAPRRLALRARKGVR